MNNPTHASSLTDVGRIRDHNEDTTAVIEPTQPELLEHRGILGVVADGMGGFEAGEIASSRAVDAFVKTYYTAEGDLGQALALAVRDANTAVREIHATRAGTTLVAAAILGDHAYLANVGDSRAYMITPDAVRQITRDHSWVEEQVLAGHLTPEQARHHPRKNILTRALGSDSYVQADYYDEMLYDGCAIMLCSDGLHGLVEDNEIGNLVRSNAPERAALELISLANKRGGHDNISVVILRKGGLDGLQTGFKTLRATRGRAKWPWILVGSLLLFLGAAIAVALHFSVQVTTASQPTPMTKAGGVEASATAASTPTKAAVRPDLVHAPSGAIPQRLFSFGDQRRLISQNNDLVLISDPADRTNSLPIASGTLRDVIQSTQNGGRVLWVLTDHELTKVTVRPGGSTATKQRVDGGAMDQAAHLDEYDGRLVFVSDDGLSMWRSQSGFVAENMEKEDVSSAGASTFGTATAALVRVLPGALLNSPNHVALVVRGSQIDREYGLFELPVGADSISGLRTPEWTSLPYPSIAATGVLDCARLDDGTKFVLWQQGAGSAAIYKTRDVLKQSGTLRPTDKTQKFVSIAANGSDGYIALLQSASGQYSWQTLDL